MDLSIPVTYSTAPQSRGVTRAHALIFELAAARQLRAILEAAIVERYTPPAPPEPKNLQDRFVAPGLRTAPAVATRLPGWWWFLFRCELVLEVDGARHVRKPSGLGSERSDDGLHIVIDPIFGAGHAASVLVVGITTEKLPAEPYSPLLRGELD